MDWDEVEDDDGLDDEEQAEESRTQAAGDESDTRIGATKDRQPSNGGAGTDEDVNWEDPNFGDGGESEMGPKSDEEVGGDGDGDDEESGKDGRTTNGKRRRSHQRVSRKRRRVRKARARANNYDHHTRRLLLDASALLRLVIMLENPFPTPEELVEMVDWVWGIALNERPAYEPDAGVEWFDVVGSTTDFSATVHANSFAKIKRALPQVRGQLRDNIRPKIADFFGFDERPHTADKNRKRYMELVESDAYLCAVSSLPPHPYLI